MPYRVLETNRHRLSETLRGYQRLLLETTKSYWSVLETAGGYQRLLYREYQRLLETISEATRDYWRLSEATGGYQRLPQIIIDYQRQLKTTRDNKRLLETIGDYQTPSGITIARDYHRLAT